MCKSSFLLYVIFLQTCVWAKLEAWAPSHSRWLPHAAGAAATIVQVENERAMQAPVLRAAELFISLDSNHLAHR